MGNNSAKRIVQFELLRILAMCGVVLNHVFNNGLLIYDDFSIDASSPLGFILWSLLELLKLIALPSVNCYILITGYFLIENTQLRWKGIWKVWSETWFYAVGLYLLSVCLCIKSFSWHDVLEYATPILSNIYWFVTSYLILIVLAPFIARAMKNATKRQYQVVLAVGAVVCFQPFLGQFLMDSQNIILFVYLFLIGGYIRRYCHAKGHARISPLLIYLGIIICMYAYTLYKNMGAGNSPYTVYAMAYHGLVLPLSVALFLWVKDWNIRSGIVKQGIYVLSPLSFAVYIVHSHPVVSELLWSFAGDWLRSVHELALPICVLAVTIIVYFVCVAIDSVRATIVKRLYSIRSSANS